MFNLRSYILIFSLFLEAVYPVGVTEIQLRFMHKIADSPQIWYWYLPLDFQYKHQISAGLECTYVSYSDFCKVYEKKKKKNFSKAWLLVLYLGNGGRNVLQTWNVASLQWRTPIL